MNTNRIASLLHYDWMLHKHTLKLTGIVIGIIYLCLALLYFVVKYELGFEGNSNHPDALPVLISFFCHSYFSYATIAAMLVTTTLLTEKFCYPRTATAYLSLPGTSFEKFFVMIAEYGIVYVVMQVYFVIMFYITMGICALNAPDMNWMQNAFIYFMPGEAMNAVEEFIQAIKGGTGNSLEDMVEQGGYVGEFANTIFGLINASVWMAPFVSIAYLGYYLILNMFFKSNVQIKAIACMFLTYFVFIVILMVTIFGIIGVSAASDSQMEEVMLGNMTVIIRFFTYIEYAAPLFAAGLYYAFYRQICRKQAK